MRPMLLLLALLMLPPDGAASAGIPEAPAGPAYPTWPRGPAADALLRALQGTHCGQAPPTPRTRSLWQDAGPGIEPISLCRCLRAAAVATKPERFLALGAEAARRGTPAWHAAVREEVDALPEETVQACLVRQRR